jgi:hypothetical protein
MEVQNQQTKHPSEQGMWTEATLQNKDIRLIQPRNMGPIKIQYTKALFYLLVVFLKTWAYIENDIPT